MSRVITTAACHRARVGKANNLEVALITMVFESAMKESDSLEVEVKLDGVEDATNVDLAIEIYEKAGWRITKRPGDGPVSGWLLTMVAERDV